MLVYHCYIFLDGIGPVETSDLYGHFRNDTLKQPWLNCDACDTRIDHNMRAQWLKEPCLAIKSLSVQDVTLSSLIVVITSCDVEATASPSKDSSSRILLQRIYLQEVNTFSIIMISDIITRWRVLALVKMLNVMPYFFMYAHLGWFEQRC